MAYFYTKDRRRVWVPSENQAAAWASGELGLVKGRVNIVSPDGETISLGQDELGKAFAAGWRLEEREEGVVREYGDKDVQSFLYGAAQGATFGLAKAALVKTGLAEEEALEGMVEANPYAYTPGEIFGMVGTAVVPGLGAARFAKGTGLAARALAGVGKATAAGKVLPAYWMTRLGASAASQAERQILKMAVGDMGKEAAGLAMQSLARGGAYAAGGVAEGAAYGTGHAISEAALGNVENAGEAFTAYIGPNALWGGMAGGVLGAASPLAKTALKRVAGRVGRMAGWLDDTTLGKTETNFVNQVRETVGMTEAQWRNLTPRKQSLFTDVLFEEGALPGRIITDDMSRTDLHQYIIDAAQFQGGRIGSIREGFGEMLGEMQKKTPQIPGARVGPEALRHPIGGLGEATPQAREIREVLEKRIKNFQQSTDPDVRGFADHLRVKYLDGEFGDPATSFDVLRRAKKDYATKARKGGRKWGDEEHTWNAISQAAERDMDRTTRAAIEHFMTRPNWQIMDIDLNRLFPGIVDELGEGLSPRIYLEAIRGAYKDSMRRYAAFADVADLAEAGALKEALNKSELPKFLASFMGTAGARMFLWGTGPVRAAVAGLGWAGARLGGRKLAARVATTQPTTKGLLQSKRILQRDKVTRLGTILEGLEAYQKKLDASIGSFLTGKEYAPGRLTALAVLSDFTKEKDPEKAAEKAADVLNSIIADPNTTSNRISASLEGLEEDAPNLATAVAAQTAMLASLGAEWTPKLPPHPTLQPTLEDRVADPGAQARFSEDLAVLLQGPEFVTSALTDGTLTRRTMEKFSRAWPRHYEALTLQLLHRIAEMDDLLGHDQALLMGTWLDTPTDGSLDPNYIRRQQAIYQAETKRPRRGGPADKGNKGKGTKKTALGKMSQSYETPGQSTERSLAK